MKKLKIKVENMISSKGNYVFNQFIIRTDKDIYFQSYGVTIVYCEYKTGKTYLDKYYWDYSRTTGKYRNEFLNENKKETQRKIDNKEYILKDLN